MFRRRIRRRPAAAAERLAPAHPAPPGADCAHDFSDNHAEGEWVVSVITARGTHEGEWLGMKPTGRALVFSGVNVDRVVDGRLVEHGGAANMLMPFLEAGALRPVSD